MAESLDAKPTLTIERVALLIAFASLIYYYFTPDIDYSSATLELTPEQEADRVVTFYEGLGYDEVYKDYENGVCIETGGPHVRAFETVWRGSMTGGGMIRDVMRRCLACGELL
ncbi:MAG: hypothetical protein AAB439_03805 [Patescibacteria group bacterium]